MGERRRIKIKIRNYRGVSAFPRSREGDEFGLFDLRPHRFAALDGSDAKDILLSLVNLPADKDSVVVKNFIDQFHNLDYGQTDSGGNPARPMSSEEVMRLRNLYRLFWTPRMELLKATIFVEQLSPRLAALMSPISTMSGKNLELYLDEHKSIYPHGDYRGSALRINWKTGAFTVTARGPIDKLTHVVFQHRNRLRVCPKCKKLFIAFASNRSFCPWGCDLERSRERKRQDARRRRKALLVAGLTSRGNKPKRKIAH